MNEFFKDLKILELASVLAGPSVGMFFAELGAEVIKVENALTSGDATRSWKLPNEDKSSPVSAYFASINYRKQYLKLDLRKSDHINQVYRLAKDSDVLISNFKFGDDLKFGLDYERIKTMNPQIIYAHLTGFNSFPERSAYDVVVQAETGYMFMNGTPESGPVKMPLALMDLLAAQQMKEAILLALLKKERTGYGSLIQCTLEASALANLSNQASNYLMAGHIPQAIGSLHPNIAPYGETMICMDQKKIVLAIGTNRQFKRLCSLLGIENISTDDRFSDNQKRVINRIELRDILQDQFAQKDRKFWMDELIDQNIPAGAVRSMDEVMELPHAKEMVREEVIEGVNTKRLSSIGFRFIE